MEEKKLNTKKVEATNTPQEPTVDQLKMYCDQLLSQRNQLMQRLEQVQNILNKLPFLFKVVENAEVFGEEFTGKCIEEIKTIMTPPEEEEEAEKEA